MKLSELYGELLDLIKQEDPDISDYQLIERAFNTALEYAECDYCSHKGINLLNNRLYCEENCKEHEL